jgi:hypothetical protein
MRKAIRTPEELNALLTAELRRVPGCEGAAWVRIYRLRKHIRGKNWLAAFLAAGCADRRDCARALIEIERRLQAEFDVVPERLARERSPSFFRFRHYHRRRRSRLLPEYGRGAMWQLFQRMIDRQTTSIEPTTSLDQSRRRLCSGSPRPVH